MTELDRPWPPRETPRRPRRRRSRGELVIDIALAVVLLLATTAVIVVQRLDAQSGPIEPGPFGGFVSYRNVVFSKDGFSTRLASTPGAEARLLEAVDNRGGHAVTITSIDTDQIVTRVRWSTYRLVPGGVISGEPEPWHDFPVTISAQGRIRLEVTVRRPAFCERKSRVDYGGVRPSSLAVHWESPLGRHMTWVEPLQNDFRIC